MIHLRRGVTLIELLVVIVILALMAGVAATALRTTGHGTTGDMDRVGAAKREGSQRGQPVRVLLHGSGHARMVTAFPDGRVIGPRDTAQNAFIGEQGDTTR